MNEVLNNEVKKIYVIKVAYSNPWEFIDNKTNNIQIYETYDVEKETQKCYKTTRGRLIRKAEIDVPSVEYLGKIAIKSLTPTLSKEALEETIKLVETENRKQKRDYDTSSKTLSCLYELRGDK